MKIFLKGLVVLALPLSGVVTVADEQSPPGDNAEAVQSSTMNEQNRAQDYRADNYRALEESLILEERILPTAEEVLPPQVLPPLPGSRQRWRSQLPSLDGALAEPSSNDAAEKLRQSVPPREPRVAESTASEVAPRQAQETGIGQAASAEISEQLSSQSAPSQPQEPAVTVDVSSEPVEAPVAAAAPATETAETGLPGTSPPAPTADQAAASMSPEQTIAPLLEPAQLIAAPVIEESVPPGEIDTQQPATEGAVIEEIATVEAPDSEAVPRETTTAPVVDISTAADLVSAEPAVVEPTVVEPVSAESVAPSQRQNLEPGSYVVQVGAFSSREKMEAYIVKNALPSAALARHVTLVNGRTWHVMTWGSFANRQAARQQWQQQGRPEIDIWVRSSESLLAVLKESTLAED